MAYCAQEYLPGGLLMRVNYDEVCANLPGFLGNYRLSENTLRWPIELSPTACRMDQFALLDDAATELGIVWL